MQEQPQYNKIHFSEEELIALRAFWKDKDAVSGLRKAMLSGLMQDGDVETMAKHEIPMNWIHGVPLELPDADYAQIVKVQAASIKRLFSVWLALKAAGESIQPKERSVKNEAR